MASSSFFIKNSEDALRHVNELAKGLKKVALAGLAPGEVIDFTQANPYANLQGTPLWPEPEYPSAVTLQNPSGAPGSSSAQVGNLGLTDEEEDDIVAFLKTLSDGFEPNRH